MEVQVLFSALMCENEQHLCEDLDVIVAAYDDVPNGRSLAAAAHERTILIVQPTDEIIDSNRDEEWFQ